MRIFYGSMSERTKQELHTLQSTKLPAHLIYQIEHGFQ